MVKRQRVNQAVYEAEREAATTDKQAAARPAARHALTSAVN